MYIDPSPAGVGTTSGILRIKGDLYVDGTQTYINSTTIELSDFQIGIGTTATSDLILDGAGIGIGSIANRKTFVWNNSSSSLKSSENLDVASGKTYKIAGTDVLSSNTLGSGIVNSSLTSVGTLGLLNVTGISTLGVTTVTNLTVQQLNVSGISTLGILTVGNVYSTGIITATKYFGDGSSLTGINTSSTATTAGYASTAGISTYAVTAGVSTNVSGGIASVTSLIVSGISTFTAGPVLVGTGTSTGTASQPLQVSGSAYISGNVGVAVTSPSFAVDVSGDTRVQSTGKMRFGGTTGTTNFYIQYNSTSNSLDFVAG